MSKTLHDLIAGTSELRSLPSTTMRLMGLLDDATVGADEVLEVIEKDPSLTANLLKLSNSAYYGLRGRVGSVREALVMLGNKTIVNLAFATSMGDILRGPLAGYHLGRNEFWHHALGTAVGASRLVSRLDSGKGEASLREKAFTGGLVHDIGKLLLNRSLKEKLVQLPPAADFQTLLAAEIDILGFDHAEAGAALAVAWNFPVSLSQLIGAHHVPEPGVAVWQDMEDEVHTLVRAVAGANVLTAYCGFGAGSAPLVEDDMYATMAQLEFDRETVEAVVASLPHDLDAMLSVIGESR
ncbi:MAG: HDOD domain-containing protein [Candidatus Krumholzibacteria bacterium]|nr:HDOD domain-containing protein [Candidatus Krumholzibacteria bacterium]